MPYARQNYTLADIKIAFRSVDTNAAQGNQLAPDGVYRPGSAFGKGKFGLQPTPHPDIHGADELHMHPLFAAARISTGGASTHSVMDETQMQTALMTAFNHNDMQQFLAALDGGADSVGVNVNYNATPGSCKVFSTANTRQQNVTAANQAVLALVLKLRRNPNNAQVPIIQTAIPYTNHQQEKTKKGKVLGFKI
jgi:hypothetical protein